MGRERIAPFHWLGAAVSVAGIYFVVGRGADFGGETFSGDLLVMVSVACWAAYTLGAVRLIGAALAAVRDGHDDGDRRRAVRRGHMPQFFTTDWTGVSAWTWASLVLSALLALNVAYLIWYMGVQKIGAARTSMYSNLVPITAMTVAAIWLGEPLSRTKLLGALAVLIGVVLTRLGRKPNPVPIEE